MARNRLSGINVAQVVRYVLQAPVDSFDALFNAVEASMQRLGVPSNRRALRDVGHASVTINLRSVIAWAEALPTPTEDNPIATETVDALVQIHAACSTRYRASGYTAKKPSAEDVAAVNDLGERQGE
jgi:hypothetical protein